MSVEDHVLTDRNQRSSGEASARGVVDSVHEKATGPNHIRQNKPNRVEKREKKNGLDGKLAGSNSAVCD
jgi:hypothetical protein